MIATLSLWLHSTDKLMTQQELDLSWRRIPAIENLDLFTNLTMLYLQHNCITAIEGLDTLLSLQILMLAGNQITKVRAIACSLAKRGARKRITDES